MTKRKSTKSALFTSIFALLLCFTMLIGTTFAWFTDSVTSANNIIKSGTLDVVLEYKTDWDNDWAPVDENTKIFKEGALYEPGYTEVVFLRISNAGSLALKYNLNVNITSEKGSTNVNGDEFKLSDYLQIGSYYQDEYVGGFNYADVLMPIMFGSREAALNSVILEQLSLADSMVVSDSPVLVGEQTAQVMALVLTMPETVGNEANYDTDYEAPEINLGISLIATQHSEESDSFGADYDNDSLYPNQIGTSNDLYNTSLQSGTFTLEADVKTSDSDKHYSNNRAFVIRDGREYILNLNGHTIDHDGTYQDGKNTGYTYLYTVAYNGKLIINGDGTINSENPEGNTSIIYAQSTGEVEINGGAFNTVNGTPVWAGNGSKITINGGSFISTGEDQELIYSSGGVIDIYGGFFHNTDWEGRPVNVANGNRGTGFINIYGGTFVNFDPSTGGDDPNNIRVADGYYVTSEVQDNGDVWYTVVPIPDGYEPVGTVNDITSAIAAGKNIVLTKDIVLTEALTIDGDFNIDLNGKKLSTVGLTFTGNVTIKNGTVASGGHTYLVPHLKISSGTLAMTDVTVDVNHHLNANVYWAEATGMEVENATAVLNNCSIKINNQTGAQWVYSYGISLNNADLTVNGGSITAICVDGTAANGPTNPNAISAMGESVVTLNNVDVTATYYATTVNGHLTINTTDTSVTSADIVDNRGGSHTLNHID